MGRGYAFYLTFAMRNASRRRGMRLGLDAGIDPGSLEIAQFAARPLLVPRQVRVKA
jgi:hypothetical protein